MLDDDLKKLLNELKMENGDKEGEVPPLAEAVKPAFAWRRWLMYGVGVAAFGFIALNAWPRLQEENAPPVALQEVPADNLIATAEDVQADDQQEEAQDPFKERELAAASWARHIVEIDPNVGKNVHIIWDMLKRRKADLEDIADELTDLLYDNAEMREDFYGSRASLLISQYQASDARHSMQIASQINSTYAMIEKKQNRDLEMAYGEMLGELGCEMYTTYQFQIAKQIIQQEMEFDTLLAQIVESKTLTELDMNQAKAEQMLTALQTDGLAQTFSSIEQCRIDLASCSIECLDRLLFDTKITETLTPDSRAKLEGILQRIGVDPEENQKYLERLDLLAEENQPKQQEAPKPTTTMQPASSKIV